MYPKEGSIIIYLEEIGIVLSLEDSSYEYDNPLAKIYLFKSNKLINTDMRLLVENSKPINIEQYALNLCNCGEKHVEYPKNHSSWCLIQNLKEGRVDELIKSITTQSNQNTRVVF